MTTRDEKAKKCKQFTDIKNIEAVATAEEVKAAIAKEVGDKEREKEIHIASLRNGIAGTLNATVLTREAEEKLFGKKMIHIGLPMSRIIPNKTVQTCFKF